MGFNDGFSTQGIPFITGAVGGQVLTWDSINKQWVSANPTGGGVGGGTVVTDGFNITGSGASSFDPIRLLNNISVNSVTASVGFSGSFFGDGSGLENIVTAVGIAKKLYVVAGATGNKDGTITDPFPTISEALTYASSSYNNFSVPVIIEVAPGTYSETLTIDRQNTYIRGSTEKSEQREVSIIGKVIINCPTAGSGGKNNLIVGLEGLFISTNTDAACVSIQGSGEHLAYLQNCYLYNTNDGGSADGIYVANTKTTSSFKLVVQDSIFRMQKTTPSAHAAINIFGGDIKLDSIQIYTTAGSNSCYANGINQSSSSIILADRLLIDISGSGIQNSSCVQNNTTAGTSASLVISNSSFTINGASENASIELNNSIGLVWNNIFTGTKRIKTALGGYLYYGSLSGDGTISFDSSITAVPLTEYFGNIKTVSVSSSSGITGSITGTLATFTNITASNIKANYLSASTLELSHTNIDYIDFDNSKWDLTGSGRTPGHQIGRTFFDSGSGDIVTGIQNGLFLNNGQQLIQKVINPGTSGVILTKGMVVHITGSDVDSSVIPRVRQADWSNDNYSANTIGLVMDTSIAPGAEGYIIIAGMLNGINTAGYSGGDILYLSSSGGFTKNKPYAPTHSVSIGQVIRHNVNNGSIYVKIQNGYELEELHDVSSSAAQHGDLLVRSGSLWISSKSLSGSYNISGAITASSGFVTPDGIVSQITAAYAAGVQGSDKYARLDIANNFLAPITASSGVLFNNGFTVSSNASGTFLGNIIVNGTASIAWLNYISQSSLTIGEKYIVIASASVDETFLDEGGLYWGSGSSGGTKDKLGAHAHVLYRAPPNGDRIEIFPGLYISGSLTASNGITGSFSGSGANINNLTGSNWRGGTASFYSDVQNAFTGSGIITIKSSIDKPGLYEISSSGNGLSSVFTEGSITGSGLETNKIRLKDNVTASYFTASVGISSSLFTGTTGSFIIVSGSQFTASNGYTGSISGNLGLFTNITASNISASTYLGTTANFISLSGSQISSSLGITGSISGSRAIFTTLSASNISSSGGFTGSFSGSSGIFSNITASIFSASSNIYGNGVNIVGVIAETAKALTINIPYNFTESGVNIIAGHLVAFSGSFLTTASCLDERKANVIGVVSSLDGNNFIIKTAGISSASNGNNFSGGLPIYVSSSGQCGTYDGVPVGGYITQVGIGSYNYTAGDILIQPRIFGVKG